MNHAFQYALNAYSAISDVSPAAVIVRSPDGP